MWVYIYLYMYNIKIVCQNTEQARKIGAREKIEKQAHIIRVARVNKFMIINYTTHGNIPFDLSRGKKKK